MAPHIRVVRLLFLLGIAAFPAEGSATPADGDEETITRAASLLPRRPPRIRVVTVDPLSPALRTQAGPSEAFVVHGDSVVYVRRQGATFQNATRRGGVFVCALAAILWHEMAHLDGAGEDGAMQREEELWRAFIVQRRVVADVGLRYLALLRIHRARPAAQREVRRAPVSAPQGLDAGWTAQEPGGRRH